MIHVALDLGSESMAAYYDDPATGKSGMIKLQDKASKLVTNLAAGSSIDYLYDEMVNGDPMSPSTRLWNHVSLQDKAQPVNPPPEHATLMLAESGNHQKSLFQYFRTKGSWERDGKKMPNPKILFQHQLREVLPTSKADPDGVVNLTPELLVKHLSLQVIINFVLDSKELKDMDKNDILLTITVPNVYSLPHAESLKEFIEDYSGIGKVEILSESDAIAYYVLTMQDENDPEDLNDFKQEMGRSIRQRKKLCLVTIDIGKGTTDLSCVLVEQPRDGNAAHTGFLSSWFGVKGPATTQTESIDKRRWHSVQGKTGKCTGGNYLNYIFALYYDKRLKAAAPVLEKALEHAPVKKIPFGFIHRSIELFAPKQGVAIYALERLIEQVKRSVTEDYEIEMAPERQQEILDDVVDQIIQAIDNSIVGESVARGATQYDDFRRQLKEALTLPQKLDNEWYSFFAGWLKPRSGPESDSSITPSSDELSSLRQQLEGYVRENVHEMFDNLRNLVKEHQAVESTGEEINKATFVVVSGQGAQFKPIRRAVREKCKELNIRETQLYMMNGVAAKEACCKGVISYRKADMRHINPRELHGTYGCLATDIFSDEPFKAFDMAQVKTKGGHTIEFSSQQQYYVIFTPRSYKEVQKSQPKKNDGATAFIKAIENQSKFVLKYDPENLNLSINDEKLDFVGFGDVSSSIYPKVWPEILEPKE